MNNKSYYIRTYGCQMNHNDSERIRKVFESFGLDYTEDPEEADYIVLNSCAVKQSAEEKLLGFGKQISGYKRDRQSKNMESEYPYVFMTGCIIKSGIKDRVRSKPVKQTHQKWKDIDWIDQVAPIKYVYRKIAAKLNKDDNVTRQLNFEEIEHYLDIEPVAFSKITGSVPISTGCNHHCNFCTVPFSRGREEFRPYSKIKSEYTKLVQNEYKQITLLGQTVNKWLNPAYKYPPNAYGWYRAGSPTPLALDIQSKTVTLESGSFSPLGGLPQSFLELLKDLDSVPGEYWLNFMSSYPNYFNDELIEYIVDSINSKSGHIIPTIHLAVQSGNNRVLESMARHHTVEEFLEIIIKFREALPQISITTDIIVGYSGETEAEFMDTVKMMEDFSFDMAYISEYSVRPDTPSGEIVDDVSKSEKRRRKDYLNKILEAGVEKRNSEMIGQSQQVLVLDRKHNNLWGKSEYGKDVEIINTGDMKDFNKFIGTFIIVEITESQKWSLKGKILNK